MRTTSVILLCAVAAACSQAKESTPEGEQTIRPTTVRAFEEGVGAGGRVVVFQDASGSAYAVHTTGEDSRRVTSSPESRC